MKSQKSMKNVNIDIPENMVDKLKEFLETLNVQEPVFTTKEDVQEDVQEGLQDGRHCGEVVRIKNHKINNGKFKFLVVWKDHTSAWVDDDECDCEYLISEYLRSKKINTAYLFCRVSTLDQAKSTSLSLDAQKNELLNYLGNDSSYKRIRVYQISGSAYYRIPHQLKKISESAGFGDIILIWRVDRLSRNIECSMEWLRNLDSKHVTIYSHQENLSFSNNKLAFYQALLDSHKEAHLLGERVRLAFKRKRDRGDEHIGSLKFGKKYHRVLDKNGATKKMIVLDNDKEVSVIQRIKSSKLTDNKLALALNRQGITKRGRTWTNRMIKNIRRSIN